MAGRNLFATDLTKRGDNLVEYYVFSPTKLLANGIISEIFDFLSSTCHINEYIWQGDPFNLKHFSETSSLPAHLYGKTYYGDNIEDEWYIVYLLMELSKKYEDIVVRIFDDDGEFLLIEAADHVPSWLDPDIADNRVFVHGGRLHIVECDRTQGILPIRNALSYVQSHSNETLASIQIQNDISNRIRGYPKKISEMKHFTTCYIPANLSALLDINPFFISPIVCAFYERDSIDIKNCETFKYFQPGTRVLRRVQMTRCLYAQLMQQEFSPEPRTGFKLPHLDSQNFKAHDLGIKLSFGAEILCRTAQKCSEVDQGSGGNSSSNSSVGGHVERDRVGVVMLSILKDLKVDIEALKKEAVDLEPSDDDSWMDRIQEELEKELKGTGAEDAIEKLPKKVKSFVNQKSSYLGAEMQENDDNEISFDPDTFMSNFQKAFDFEDPKSSSSYSELDEYDSESCSDEEEMLSAEGKASWKNIMNTMDKELSATGVGKSFLTKDKMDGPNDAASTHKTSWATWGKKKNADSPRSKATSSARKEIPKATDDDDNDGDCESDGDFKPVDIDMNLVQNLLKSYSAQQGTTGPSSVIMNSLGLNLPPLDSDDDDDNENTL